MGALTRLLSRGGSVPKAISFDRRRGGGQALVRALEQHPGLLGQLESLGFVFDPCIGEENACFGEEDERDAQCLAGLLLQGRLRALRSLGIPVYGYSMGLGCLQAVMWSLGTGPCPHLEHLNVDTDVNGAPRGRERPGSSERPSPRGQARNPEWCLCGAWSWC